MYIQSWWVFDTLRVCVWAGGRLLDSFSLFSCFSVAHKNVFQLIYFRISRVKRHKLFESICEKFFLLLLILCWYHPLYQMDARSFDKRNQKWTVSSMDRVCLRAKLLFNDSNYDNKIYGKCCNFLKFVVHFFSLCVTKTMILKGRRHWLWAIVKKWKWKKNFGINDGAQLFLSLFFPKEKRNF